TFLIHHLLIHEIIQDRREFDHSRVRQRVLAALGILIGWALRLLRWLGSVHKEFNQVIASSTTRIVGWHFFLECGSSHPATMPLATDLSAFGEQDCRYGRIRIATPGSGYCSR